MTTDNCCFYFQNRLIQTSQTGGQWYIDTFPFSIPWSTTKLHCIPKFLKMQYRLFVCCVNDREGFITLPAGANAIRLFWRNFRHYQRKLSLAPEHLTVIVMTICFMLCRLCRMSCFYISMLSVIMMSVKMPTVIMLNVIMLSVVTPCQNQNKFDQKRFIKLLLRFKIIVLSDPLAK
jgi:hypothetical protein